MLTRLLSEWRSLRSRGRNGDSSRFRHLNRNSLVWLPCRLLRHGLRKRNATMSEADIGFIIGSLFGAYVTGWSAGIVHLYIKKTLELMS